MHRPATRRGGAGVVATAFGLAAVAAALGGRAAGAPAGAVWTSKTAGLEVHGIESLRIATKGPEIWYASVFSGRDPAGRRGVCESRDKGKTWAPLKSGLEDPVSQRDHYEITLDPKEEKVFYVVGRGKIYKTENAGAKFELANNGTTTFSTDRSQSRAWIAGVVVDPSNNKRLLAGTRVVGYDGGLFESADGGKTWTQIAGTGEAKPLETSGLGRDAWPIALDSRSDKYVLVGGAHEGSIWASDDKGRHFKRSDPVAPGPHVAYAFTEMQGRETFLAESRGLWRTRDAGETWVGKQPLVKGVCTGVDIDPGNRRQVYAVIRGLGLYRTENLTDWTGPLHPEIDAFDVVCHPHAPKTILITSKTTGLWISTDRGETVAPLGGLPAATPAVTHVVAHAADPTQVMAVTDTGLVYVSQNRGESWTRPGNLGGPITRLLSDNAAATTWLAAGNGVFLTTDLGATWQRTLAPPDGEERVVDLQRLQDGTLLALLEHEAKIASSKDGGKTWDKKTIDVKPVKNAWATGLAADPRDPTGKHLLVSMRSTLESGSKNDKEGGPYESKDGGATWTQLEAGFVPQKGAPREGWNHGAGVAFDLATGAMLYAADGAGLFRWEGAAEKPAWAEVALAGAPAKPTFLALHFGMTPDGAGTEILLQAGGATTRALLRSSDGGRTWAALPDPQAQLVSISADPAVPGRYLTGDASGDRGVLVYGVPGEAPPAPAGGTPPGGAPGAGPGAVPAAPTERPVEGLVAFTAGADRVGHVYDLHKGEVQPVLMDHAGELLAIVLSRDESRIYTGGADKLVKVWNGKSCAPMGQYEGHNGPVQAVALSPDGERLYVGDAAFGILAWDTTTGKAHHKFEGHTGIVYALAVSPDGTKLYSGSADKTARIWEAGTGRELVSIPLPAEAMALALSPDGTKLYVGGRDKAVKVFDAATGGAAGSWDVHGTFVSSMAASPDGKTLWVTTEDKAVEGLSTADGKASAQLEGSPASSTSVAVSRDGAWVVAGGEDGVLRMWLVAKPSTPAWASAKDHKGVIRAVALTNDVPEPAGGPGKTPPPAGPPAMGETPPAPPAMGETPPPAMGEAPPTPAPGMGGTPPPPGMGD